MIAESITWGQFAGASCLAAGVYYAYLIVSGKIKLSGILNSPSSQTSSASPKQDKKRIWHVEEVPQQPPDEDFEPAQNDQSFEKLEALAIVVQQIISGAGEQADKATLLQNLSTEIGAFPEINQPAFRAAISNIIIKAAKVDCLMDITKAEAEALWGQP